MVGGLPQTTVHLQLPRGEGLSSSVRYLGSPSAIRLTACEEMGASAGHGNRATAFAELRRLNDRMAATMAYERHAYPPFRTRRLDLYTGRRRTPRLASCA